MSVVSHIFKGPIFWAFLVLLASFLPTAAVAEKNVFKSLLESGGVQRKNLDLDLQAAVDPLQVGPGGRFRLFVDAAMAPGWHIYSLHEQINEESVATRLQLEDNLFHSLGGWEESRPRLIMDQVLKKMVKTHAGMAQFHQWQVVPEQLKPGKYPLQGSLVYRICDNKTCSLPKTLRFKTWIEVVEKK